MKSLRELRYQTKSTRQAAQFGLAAGLLIALSSSCAVPSPTPVPLPTATAAPEPAVISLDVLPAGATVLVDGKTSGQTPVSLTLQAGSYNISVKHEGYAALERAIDLAAGQTLQITETLRDIAAPQLELNELAPAALLGAQLLICARATDNVAIRNLRLFIDGTLMAEVPGGELEYSWDTQGDSSGWHELVVEATDDEGNLGRETIRTQLLTPPTPSARPSPLPSPTDTPSVSVVETSLNLPTYPFSSFLRERLDTRYNWRVQWLDRAAYEAALPIPQPRRYAAVVLENPYLKLVIIPELGGRLYQCTFKPTGQTVFYQNSVIKPSYWGPLDRSENWWLAAGGMEWALPVQEHGYEWGVPWAFRTVSGPDSASVILSSESGTDRVSARITVTLPADAAYFTVEPELANPTAQSVALQFWINAALTLGSSTTSWNTQFALPAERVIVHSTGDPSLPGERQSLSWPVYNGRDLSRYGNWSTWLGVFVPEPNANYAGAYNHDTDLGVVRLFPADVAPGVKLFAFGAAFPARAEYSDDGSEYFELWGGPCRSFWAEDDVTIRAGQSLRWSEVWLPFSGIEGLDAASANAVATVALQGHQLRLAIAAATAGAADLRTSWNGQLVHAGLVALDPRKPVALSIPLPTSAAFPGEVHVVLTGQEGRTLLDFVHTVDR